MKTNYLLIIIFIFSFLNSSFSQSFAPQGAYWYYTESFSFSGAVNYIYGYVTGDTLINGISCKTLQFDASCKPGNKRYVYQTGDSIFLYHENLKTFQLLYAFNAQKGDSYSFLNLSDSLSQDTVLVTVTVDSVYTISNNGFNYKALDVTYQTTFNNMPTNTEKSTIIEHIGDLNYMFNFYESSVICDDNYPKGLRCYFDNNISLWKFSTDVCDYSTLSINESVNPSWQFYPNPVANTLQISSTFKGSTQIEIFDVLGHCVYLENLNFQNNLIQINLTNLSHGLYMLKVTYNNQVFSGRILKQ